MSTSRRRPYCQKLFLASIFRPQQVVAASLRVSDGGRASTTVSEHPQEYLHAARGQLHARRAYVRMEPAAGERFEIDWAHFGALDYQGDARRLYAFCLVERYSRRLYVEFTPSQSFETFVRCHLHAFKFMGEVARELWYDNLATAVAGHDDNLVRFHPRLLGFAREYNFLPRACHVRAAWKKGKIERSVRYLWQSFWPLRNFTDLADANLRVRRWLEKIANRRRHRETRQTPEKRFRPETLRPLPAIAPDYRDTKVGESIAIANHALNVLTSGFKLSRDAFYQISNRMAWGWRLASLGVPVTVLYLGFVKDAYWPTGA